MKRRTQPEHCALVCNLPRQCDECAPTCVDLRFRIVASATVNLNWVPFNASRCTHGYMKSEVEGHHSPAARHACIAAAVPNNRSGIPRAAAQQQLTACMRFYQILRTSDALAAGMFCWSAPHLEGKHAGESGCASHRDDRLWRKLSSAVAVFLRIRLLLLLRCRPNQCHCARRTRCRECNPNTRRQCWRTPRSQHSSPTPRKWPITIYTDFHRCKCCQSPGRPNWPSDFVSADY